MGGVCAKGAKAGATVSPDPQREAEQVGCVLKHAPPAGTKSKRRGSVSAEPSGGRAALPRMSVGKPVSSAQKIRELVRSTLLFKELDEEQEAGVIDAMFERKVSAGEVVIREGEEADNFYVIESGTFVATKAAAGGEGPSSAAPLATYEGRGAFGELALMYNCPRAATVTALTEGMLWGVDRATFRSLVVRSMEERRRRHEAALRRVPLLQHLSPAQLAAVADCLHQETFEAGEHILCEGAPLDEAAKFYMIESGRVDCFRTFEGVKRGVTGLREGEVFGEVALLTKAPRQADCVAATRCKCLTLSRDAFERLMGPVEEVLSQQIAAYERSNREHEEAAGKDGEHGAARKAAASVPGGRSSGSEGGVRGVEGKGTTAAEHGSVATEHAACAVDGPACAAAPATGVARARTATPTPRAPGSPCAGGAAALLPGSPRPPPGSVPSFGRRRSCGRSGGARSTASSEAEGGSAASSPTLPASSSQPGDAPGSQAARAAAPAAASDAGAGAEAEGEEAPAAHALPTIAEEPAETPASRPSSLRRGRSSAAAAAAAHGIPKQGSGPRRSGPSAAAGAGKARRSGAAKQGD